ncbi:MAG: hypothetical protein EHM13_11220, partial [Acidobacteria bacterium]
MKSRALRVVLVLVAVVALAGAGYFAYATARANSATRRDQVAFESDAWRVHSKLAEVRAALPAYVSAGQGPAFWSQRNEDMLQGLAPKV